jgi:hypothetical protein
MQNAHNGNHVERIDHVWINRVGHIAFSEFDGRIVLRETQDACIGQVNTSETPDTF